MRVCENERDRERYARHSAYGGDSFGSLRHLALLESLEQGKG